MVKTRFSELSPERRWLLEPHRAFLLEESELFTYAISRAPMILPRRACVDGETEAVVVSLK